MRKFIRVTLMCRVRMFAVGLAVIGLSGCYQRHGALSRERDRYNSLGQRVSA